MISVYYRVTSFRHARHSTRHHFLCYQNITVYGESYQGTHPEGATHSKVSGFYPSTCSVLKSSPVQSFCPNFRQLATGLVAKFLKTRQLATELVATSCNQSFKRPVQDC